MSRKKSIPGFYRKNVVRNAARKYINTGKTEDQRNHDHRISTGEVFTLCIQIALNDAFGIGEERLQRIIDGTNAVADQFCISRNILGTEKAKKNLQQELKDIMPEPFILPAIEAPKNQREWIQLGEKREAAEIIMMIYVKVLHREMRFAASRVAALMQTTEKIYREFGEYAKDGDYYGMKVLADRVGQIINAKVVVDDSNMKEPVFGRTLI